MFLKLFLPILLLLAALTEAQLSLITPRDDYLAGLLKFLDDSKLTTFSSALSRVASTERGHKLICTLEKGKFTLLPPTNDALEPAIKGQDDGILVSLLSYYVMVGSVTTDEVISADGRTIVPTLLKDKRFVDLGRGKGQVQILEKASDGKGVIVSLPVGVANVIGSAKYKNLIVHTIDAAVPPPGDLRSTFELSLVSSAPNGFQEFSDAFEKYGLFDDGNHHRRMLLAGRQAGGSGTSVMPVPSPPPLRRRSTNPIIARTERDRLKRILLTHILPDIVLYSTKIEDGTCVIAASGVKLHFKVENGTTWVEHDESKRRVRLLRSDVPTKNGVVNVLEDYLV